MLRVPRNHPNHQTTRAYLPCAFLSFRSAYIHLSPIHIWRWWCVEPLCFTQPRAYFPCRNIKVMAINQQLSHEHGRRGSMYHISTSAFMSNERKRPATKKEIYYIRVSSCRNYILLLLSINILFTYIILSECSWDMWKCIVWNDDGPWPVLGRCYKTYMQTAHRLSSFVCMKWIWIKLVLEMDTPPGFDGFINR